MKLDARCTSGQPASVDVHVGARAERVAVRLRPHRCWVPLALSIGISMYRETYII